MGNFRSNSRDKFGGRSSGSKFGGRSERRGGFQRRPDNNRFEGSSRKRDDFEDRDFRSSERRPPLEMHDVVCATCGKDCQVPFKPTTDKPVFCNDCFKKNDNPRNQERSSPSAMSSEQFNKLNAKLDKILQIIEED